MKKLLLLFFLFYIYQANAQQNLVLNPSFEQTNAILSCNYYQTNYFPVVDWAPVANTSPDLVTNTLNAGCETSSLHSSITFEPPLTGNNYIALINFQPNQYYNRFTREYIRGKLSQPLQPGIPYTIVFNVCLGNRSNVGMNKLGIKFINNTFVPSVPSGDLIFFSEPHAVSNTPVSNLNNWFQITLNYTPTTANLDAFFIGIFSDIPQVFSLPGIPINGVSTSYILMDDIKVYSNFLPEFNLQSFICKGTELTFPTVSTNGISGTWFPAPNNQQTTTYVFTPDNPIYGTYTKTIVVANQMVPTFTQLSYFCDVAEIDGLPTISNNGLEGVWTPEFNPYQTTTYTFTPNLPCALSTQMIVRVGITPEFSPIGPFCLEASITGLPAVSNNGVVGTWSPAFDPTQTRTYSFLPNTSICPVGLHIKVEQVPTFDQIGPFCQEATITSLPTVSNNGVTGTWSPAFNPYQTQTYTFVSNSSCGLSTEMTIVIGDIPEFSQIGPFCGEATITSLPTVSNNGVSGTWSPAFNPYQTQTYIFTPINNLCPVELEVVVEQVPIFDQIEPFCVPDLSFSLPTVSNNGISGIWNPPFNPFQTTMYTFVSDSFCGLSTEMIVVIKDKPQFTQLGPFCDIAEIDNLPTISNNGIEGTWSPAFNPTQTETYTFTPNDAQCNETIVQTIIIETIPIFDSIDPFCEPDLNFNLPTISTNGISGSWLPEFDPYNSQTYTFTRDFGDCTQQVTLDVVVYAELDFSLNTYCNEGEYLVDINAINFSLSEITDIKWIINNTSVSEVGSKLNLSNYLSLLQEINTIEVIFTDSNGCLHTTEVYVLGEYLCNIQKGISPNGDGLNEYFDLVSFGGVDLKIFNRYGSVVYEKSNYKNEWKGQSNSGKQLPTGTYFYVIKTKIGEEFSGYIQLTY